VTTAEKTAYDGLLVILEAELAVVADAFGGLSDAEWAMPTLLVPPEAGKPPWTLCELAGHLDVSIGITTTLAEDPRPGQPERDAVSFFIFPGTDVPTDFYEYAYTMVAGKTAADLAGTLGTTFSASLREARVKAPDAIGEFPGFEPYPLIRMDDWITTRIVEAVVHGMDLTDALHRPVAATTAGVTHTAALFDNLLARRADPGRPDDLGDDLAWVRAAAGRDKHIDARLPLIS
jgi:hypothetical protein